MIRTSRRGLIRGAAAAGVLAGTRAGAALLPAALRIGDSTLPASRAFLADAGFVPNIDLAQDRRSGWRALRLGPEADRIDGLTRWSDWVAVRGVLLAQGYRVTAEQRLGGTGAGPALFRWSVARRVGPHPDGLNR